MEEDISSFFQLSQQSAIVYVIISAFYACMEALRPLTVTVPHIFESLKAMEG